jgi:hypothetical protein
MAAYNTSLRKAVQRIDRKGYVSARVSAAMATQDVSYGILDCGVVNDPCNQ